MSSNFDGFKIINPSAAIEQANSLVDYSKRLNSIISDLETCLTNIEGSWSSEAGDKRSYINGLKTNINSFSALSQGILKCANIINYYTQSGIEISNNTI